MEDQDRAARPALAELLARWEAWRDRVALVDAEDGPALTYGELATRARSAASALRARVGPGPAVVGLVGRGDPGWWIEFVGAVIAGVVVVPAGADTRPESRLVASGAGWVRAEDGIWTATGSAPPAGHPGLARLASTGHAGLVLYTSGSTGEPRGTLHDLDLMLGRLLGRRVGSPLRILALLRHDHVGGIDVVLRALTGGSTLVLPRSRDPGSVARIVEARAVEVLPASPSFLALFLLGGHASARRLRGLRRVPWGAEPMPAPLLARLRALLPEASFEPRFGTTETGPLAVAPAPGGDPCAFLVQGRGETWRVVDGELQLRRPEGYLGTLGGGGPEDESASGWQRTGDAAEEIEGGFRVLGRLVEQINVGGRKVRPSVVEAALLAHPAVLAARVEGRPHALLGAEVTAIVQPVDAAAAGAELRGALRAHCRGLLQPYEVPSRVEWSDALVDPSRVKVARRGGTQDPG